MKATIVGFKYQNQQPQCLQSGQTIKFKEEPDNQYDPNAIAVYVGDVRVGYVQRDYIAGVRHVLQGDYSVSVTRLTSASAVVEVESNVSEHDAVQMPTGV